MPSSTLEYVAGFVWSVCVKSSIASLVMSMCNDHRTEAHESTMILVLQVSARAGPLRILLPVAMFVRAHAQVCALELYIIASAP